ncbi:MAG: hypothetical protein AAF430_14540 [Myxococcota bacterium]
MSSQRKLWISAWILLWVGLQVASIGTRREWWPFAPITMYSGSQTPTYSGLALLAVEADGRHELLAPDQAIGPHPYVFVYRVLAANREEPAAIAWAAGHYAEQRRREGRALPASFELARVTWTLALGGDRHDPWQEKQTLARHAY